MEVGTSVTKGTFLGIKVSCFCSSLEERSVPPLYGQLVGYFVPSDAGLVVKT